MTRFLYAPSQALVYRPNSRKRTREATYRQLLCIHHEFLIACLKRQANMANQTHQRLAMARPGMHVIELAGALAQCRGRQCMTGACGDCALHVRGATKRRDHEQAVEFYDDHRQRDRHSQPAVTHRQQAVGTQRPIHSLIAGKLKRLRCGGHIERCGQPCTKVALLATFPHRAVLDPRCAAHLPGHQRKPPGEIDRSRGVPASGTTELVKIGRDTHRKHSQLDCGVLHSRERVGPIYFASQEIVYRRARVAHYHRDRRTVHEPRTLRRPNPTLCDRERILESVQQMQVTRTGGRTERLPHHNIALKNECGTAQ